MILLTRINKVDQFYVNEDMIEFLEETPDTVISMESGRKVLVMESPEEVLRLIFEQKTRLLNTRPPKI